MRREERIIWFLQQLLGLLTTDGGHIGLLATGAILAVHFYPAALAPLGAALLLKLKQ